jgi:hypothetical protein
MFSSELFHDGHTKRLTITRSGDGWEVREEHDSQMVRKAHYSDWHRVERARAIFALHGRVAAEARGVRLTRPVALKA